MKQENAPYALNALLYSLNYIRDVQDDPIIPDHLVTQIKNKYKPELVKGMCEALIWAKNSQDFDFASQLPLRQNNLDIVIYLKKMNDLFKEKEIFHDHGFN